MGWHPARAKWRNKRWLFSKRGPESKPGPNYMSSGEPVPFSERSPRWLLIQRVRRPLDSEFRRQLATADHEYPPLLAIVPFPSPSRLSNLKNSLPAPTQTGEKFPQLTSTKRHRELRQDRLKLFFIGICHISALISSRKC